MEFRKRLLIVLMAVSLVVVFDVFANGSLVTSRMALSMLRTSTAMTDSLIGDHAPFLAKQGTLAESTDGVERIVVKGAGDIQVIRADSRAMTLEYGVRTYAISSRHAQTYHDQAQVRLARVDDSIQVVFDQPTAGSELLGFHTSYSMTVPDGVAVEIEDVTGSASLHGLTGPLVVRRPGGALTVTEHSGAIRVEESEGSTWLAGVRGDVDITHRRGHVELIDIDGEVTVGGERTSVLAETIKGNLTAHVDRGVGLFYSVGGNLTAVASKAHVTVDGIAGRSDLVATASPVELGASLGPVSLTTEGANVRLNLAESGPRALDIRVERGEIETDLPLAVEREGSGVSLLVGTIGPQGGHELFIRSAGGDVTIELDK